MFNTKLENATHTHTYTQMRHTRGNMKKKYSRNDFYSQRNILLGNFFLCRCSLSGFIFSAHNHFVFMLSTLPFHQWLLFHLATEERECCGFPLNSNEIFPHLKMQNELHSVSSFRCSSETTYRKKTNANELFRNYKIWFSLHVWQNCIPKLTYSRMNSHV